MKKKKRIYRTIIGIPVWVITGLAMFSIFSVGYDLLVGDQSWMRIVLLTVSVLILLVSIILHIIPVSAVRKIARRQMGGN